MPLINLVVVLIVVGVLLWLIGMIPMDGTILRIIRVVVLVVVVLWLLQVFGILASDITVGHTAHGLFWK